MATTVLPYTHLQYFLNDGSPNAGGTLTFYQAGTTTPLDTFNNIDLAPGHENPNPLTLNSAGRPSVSGIEVNIYTTASTYKILMKDSSGTTIWTADQVPAAASAVGLATGTVTSVAMTVPAGFVITGSPITSSGTLAVTNALNYTAGICEGRLTLTSGTAVTTADVTGATTVYFTPYHGNTIELYDGVSVWNRRKFAEISTALGTLTSGLPYDIFCFDNSGTPALRSPVAWASATTRTTTALVLQDGVLVKTGATTDRYLGTFYTTSTTQTEDSFAKRYLWNYYNRVERAMRVVEATDSWTYTTATYRQANAGAANQLAFVIGVQEVLVKGQVTAWASNSTNDGSTNVLSQVAIGEDSTSSPDASCMGIGNVAYTGGAAGNAGARNCWLQKYTAVGRHVWVWLERSQATNTTTWYGDNGDSTLFQAGIFGWLFG